MMLSKIGREKANKVLLVLGCLLFGGLAVSAQQAGEKTAAPDAEAKAAVPRQTPRPMVSNSFTTSLDDHYKIGPGDVLDIRILNRPNLSREAIRVEGNGEIRLPLIDIVGAACLTEAQLEKEIATRYLKYYRNPQVNVFIKEYHSTQVAVLGFVNEQGRFQLQRRIRLLELLTYAKGASTNAGQTINIIHSGTAFQCQSSAEAEVASGLSSYRLSDTLRGEDKANPYLENGDIVTLPEADQVYVVGNVLGPRSIPLKEPISLTRAIAMSGGLGKDTKKDKIRIVRQEPGSPTKKEIYVDLSAIEKKQADDIALLPNDIVDVPISGTKSILHSLVGGIAPAVTQLPVRVIP
jgi:polysaccharide biosynthesis/export protein